MEINHEHFQVDQVLSHTVAGSCNGHFRRFGRTSNLIGQEVRNSRNDEVVGTVEEILIDHEGQVAAVVLGTGGMMGLGEKDVAISWDQLERTMGKEGEIELAVDFSEASIADAPTFSRGDDNEKENDDNDRN